MYLMLVCGLCVFLFRPSALKPPSPVSLYFACHKVAVNRLFLNDSLNQQAARKIFETYMHVSKRVVFWMFVLTTGTFSVPPASFQTWRQIFF